MSMDGMVWSVNMDIDGLAERYYANNDPQFEPSADDEIEINDRASRYVATACINAIDDLTQEERESLADDTDLLWDLINEHLWNN